MRMLWVMMGMFVPCVAPSLTLKRCPCVTSVNSYLPLFFWADSSSQPHLYPYCSFAKFLFVCTMFTFTSSPAKTAANSGGSSGSDGQDVANMSLDQMRALLAQQQARWPLCRRNWTSSVFTTSQGWQN